MNKARLSLAALGGNNPHLISATIYPYFKEIVDEEWYKQYKGTSQDLIVNISGEQFIEDAIDHFIDDANLASNEEKAMVLEKFTHALYPEIPNSQEVNDDDFQQKLNLLTTIRDILFSNYQRKPRIVKPQAKTGDKS
ncbi:hypothetical protein BI308_23250 [Roseofilum reptotaenium AO1-A]|uniref:Uncharacterized protein n=2 Tax=Roseofilum TaxID=1233426 RepID=A0A1L9QKL6_9CYAN|nr:hypothetical protein BI308_23250 [Roseofilum reptotaenium AO1-A]